MNTSSPIRRFIFAMLAVLLVFACDDGGDQRKQTERALGEPDILATSDYSTFEMELWVYAQRDINRVYEFRRSSGTCGGNGEWYLYRRYMAYGSYYFEYELYDPPPVITHEPVISVPAAKAITINAVVEMHEDVLVDTEITGVRLNYRVAGDSLITTVGMSTSGESDSLFSAQIPAEYVTATGVEYYIEACSNNDTDTDYHWSRLPFSSKQVFFVEVPGTAAKVEYAGYRDTSAKPVLTGRPPEPGGGPFTLSPMSQ